MPEPDSMPPLEALREDEAPADLPQDPAATYAAKAFAGPEVFDELFPRKSRAAAAVWSIQLGSPAQPAPAPAPEAKPLGGPVPGAAASLPRESEKIPAVAQEDSGPPKNIESDPADLGSRETFQGEGQRAEPTIASERPASQAGQPAPSPEAEPAYTLRRIVGKGGMGEVWEASQNSLQRLVAVKRIRLDSIEEGDYSIREWEFGHEAFATARLDHPNIVPVHDLGRDENGLPLLAMKLARGKPWDKALAADFAALPALEFLEKHLPVLLDVAQATAFAHSKGIIHRDIKPAQVMTGEFGEVLLMDWGLAIYAGASPEYGEPPEALSKRLRAECLASAQAGEPPLAQSLPTPANAGGPAGTPALMAPEQTIASASGIGPWTDVYLLGGTLYKILTGTYPHSSATCLESLNKARAGAVVPPEEAAPGRDVPPELSALCMKALARYPKKRHRSAGEFVQELQDCLSGASKRRESETVANEAAAKLKAGGSDDYAFYNQRLAEIDRARALWPANPALPALEVQALSGSADLAIGHGDLKLARSQAERLPGGALHHDLFRRLEAAEERERKRQKARFVANCIIVGLLGVMLFGGTPLAWQASKRADALVIRSGSTQRLVEGVLKDLRGNLDFGDPANAAAIEAVTARVVEHYMGPEAIAQAEGFELSRAADMNNVALILDELGRYAEAEKLLLEALRIHRAGLGERHASVAFNLNNLAALRDHQGRPEEAEKLYLEALEMAPEAFGLQSPETARLMNNLGTLLMQHDKLGRAKELLEKAISVWEKAGPDSRGDLAKGLSNLGSAHMREGLLAPAEEYYARAMKLEQELLKPGDPSVAKSLNRLGVLRSDQGRLREAEELFQKAGLLWEKSIGSEHPDYAANLGSLASLKGALGRFEEARELAERGEAIGRKTLGEDNYRFAGAWLLRGRLLAWRGQPAEAASEVRRALAAWERELGPKHPLPLGAKSFLAELELERGELGEAERLAAEALAARDAIAKERSLNPSRRAALSRDAATLARTALQRRDPAKAEAFARQALNLGASADGAPVVDALGPKLLLARTRLALAKALEDQPGRDPAEIRSLREAALAATEPAPGEAPTVESLEVRAEAFSALGRDSEAQAVQAKLDALRG